ncbi:PadR family transcriptional regulator [Rugosimonospora acidiphila]|uniref:PadR family transcriptional regulator n=1 Tax=Rugosimonospora acidiphila TaxID=556531 RepID=UPI0031E854AA
MDQERRSQWLRGVLDMCVLAMVSSGESYGYRLVQAMEQAGLGPIKGGTLYPVLLRLESTGLVATDWRHGPSGPARKYYRITGAGQAALRQAMLDWQAFSSDVTAILRNGNAILQKGAEGQST